MLLGEGSAAEQMRDSGKIITTARQDELDKLSEGINFAFSRQFTTLRQYWQHAACTLFTTGQLTSIGIGEPQPSLTGVASYSPQGETTYVLTDSPLHTLASLCALLTMYRLAQATTHSPQEVSSPSITPLHSAAHAIHAIHTLHTHGPTTHSHILLNPTAELMQVEISGGSTKDGGSITADDTPAYPTPLRIFVPVSVFQDDNSNPLQ
jgi:hypothetical protein